MMLPETNEGAIVTLILLVPLPEAGLIPAGKVQVYEVAPNEVAE